MLPVLLLTGATLASYVGGTIYFANRSEKKLNQRIMNAGGHQKVNSVTLVSSNYRDKVRTNGKGIPISSYGHDWETCEFELKLAAAQHNCNIVTNIRKEGTDEMALISRVQHIVKDKTYEKELETIVKESNTRCNSSFRPSDLYSLFPESNEEYGFNNS